jgi:leucyl aminopeptidase
MKLSSTTDAITDIQTPAAFVFCYEDELAPAAAALDEQSKQTLSKLLARKAASGKAAEITPIFHPANCKIDTLYLVGCGKKDKFNENALVKVVAAITSIIKKAELSDVHIALDDLEVQNRTAHWNAQKITERMLAGLYKYDTTKSDKNPELKLDNVTLVAKEPGLELAIDTGRCMAHGINVARELGNLPGNVCTPTYLATQARNLAEAYDEIHTEVLDEKEMEALGMGCLLSVSRGSDEPAKLIVMQYKGAGDDQKAHVLVGKGITFDTGGISLKPAPQMDEMKYDMGGAASVLGTMNAIAELKPSINVIGVIASAENMPSGRATKPGDVVTSMSGKTVEILNTDAEGRLVLCDALTYVEKFEPASVIDIATLTGAVIVGLGHHPTAVYANNEDLQQQILEAGKAIWDRGWPMPLWEEYGEELTSEYADLPNIGAGRAAGSITAAAFLSKFTEKYNWAHLDIAGTAWKDKKSGASGRPVGMLTQYLLDQAN